MTKAEAILLVVEEDYVYYMNTHQDEKAKAYCQTLIDIGYEINVDMESRVEELRRIGLKKRILL